MKQKEEREGGGKRAVQVFQPFQQRREPRATFPGPDQSFLARYKLRYRGHSTELHVQAKVPRYRPPTGLVEPSPAHPLITHPPTLHCSSKIHPSHQSIHSNSPTRQTRSFACPLLLRACQSSARALFQLLAAAAITASFYLQFQVSPTRSLPPSPSFHWDECLTLCVPPTLDCALLGVPAASARGRRVLPSQLALSLSALPVLLSSSSETPSNQATGIATHSNHLLPWSLKTVGRATAGHNQQRGTWGAQSGLVPAPHSCLS